jgi:hypothetical protein
VTIHHDIALALSVLLVISCIVFAQHCGQHIKDIITFATTIAVATFAHAQGVKAGAAAARARDDQGHGR